MVNVFLVEDSPLVCERLEALLASVAGVVTVGRAIGADEATRSILAGRPDAVVLDLKLAQGSGFDVLRVLQDQAPEIDVYVLSNLAAEPYRRRAERLGARGFFDKTNEFERVRDTLAARAAQFSA
jgi:two-component system, NarL family, response regulator DevR